MRFEALFRTLLMSRAPRALLLRILPVLDPRLSAARCAFAQRVELVGPAAQRRPAVAQYGCVLARDAIASRLT